jgi:hypothetical protein
VGQDATRRGVLAATAATLPLLAGCKGIGALGTPPAPQADVAAARAAIAAETRMITRYKAVMAAVPSLRGRLQPLLSQHEEHLTRLRGRLIDPGSLASALSAAGAGSGGRVPRTPTAAMAFLRRAEGAAASALAGHLQTASPSFAQLLASIAASEATHALVLGPHGRRA